MPLAMEEKQHSFLKSQDNHSVNNIGNQLVLILVTMNFYYYEQTYQLFMLMKKKSLKYDISP